MIGAALLAALFLCATSQAQEPTTGPSANNLQIGGLKTVIADIRGCERADGMLEGRCVDGLIDSFISLGAVLLPKDDYQGIRESLDEIALTCAARRDRPQAKRSIWILSGIMEWLGADPKPSPELKSREVDFPPYAYDKDCVLVPAGEIWKTLHEMEKTAPRATPWYSKCVNRHIADPDYDRAMIHTCADSCPEGTDEVYGDFPMPGDTMCIPKRRRGGLQPD